MRLQYGVVFTIIITLGSCDILRDYYAKRSFIIKEETRHILGENITLTDKETVVNNCLMQHKFEELDYAFDNPRYFNYSHHYFEYRNRMRQRKLYRMIKDMPKGAALHIHDMALMGPDYLLNITYMDHLYVCFDTKPIRMRFSNRIPSEECSWQLMSDARTSAKNLTEFDAKIRQHFTMVVEDPDVVYPSINETWKSFMNYFRTVAQILTYRPVWESYFYDALKRFKEDNVAYLEVRSILPPLYELDGMVYDQLITAKAYKKAINRFVKENPGFIGAKLIFAPSRQINITTLDSYIDLAKRIKKSIPETFAGFDLVGQEDLGQPLIEFVPQLLTSAKDLNYFFHAGETDWYGTLTDQNLIDAVLLETKRIGHGYALLKHPLIMEEIKQKQIALEVSLISNTVLSLVRDVRNHPLSVFLANNLPVVLSSDDPGAWEAGPLTDDFYVAFVGASSRLADIRLLKTLAINSLRFSVLEEDRKMRALRQFDEQWNKFVNEFDCSKY